MNSAETTAFEAWWDTRGGYIDPDPSVPWSDKRKGLAEFAFRAAMAQSRNYVANNVVGPTEITFANGRRVLMGKKCLLVPPLDEG